MDLLARFPELEDRKRDALNTRFFGQPVSELTRDELLALVGFLTQQQRQESHNRRKERDFWYALSYMRRR